MLSMEINHIILKMTSVCNLSCRYCYVFNKKDLTYVDEPDVMSDKVIRSTIKCIEEYCQRKELDKILLTFHGGEPLMAGKDFFYKFINLSKQLMPSIKINFTLQTNGTLLTKEWCELFKDLNIQVGISMDGNRAASINRVYKNDNGEAYDKILDGYKLLNGYVEFGVLSVINVLVNPIDYYLFFKSISVKYLDCLFPDVTYDMIDENVSRIGLWVCELFDLWYHDNDKNKPTIKIFTDIINLLLGGEITGELFGTGFNGAIDIKPDGTIDIVDTLKICDCKLTDGRYNTNTNRLDDIIIENVFDKFYNAHQEDVLCSKCKGCLIKEICGGGLLAHRYSKSLGFDNPTVYCKEVFMIISHIQNTIIDDLPFEFIEDAKLHKLTMVDLAI